MTIKKFTTSAIVAASLIAANLSPLATAADARDGRHGGYGGYDRGYSSHYDGPRHNHRHYDGGPRHRYAYKRHRHKGNDVAKGIAIGLGILAVGSILASGSHR